MADRESGSQPFNRDRASAVFNIVVSDFKLVPTDPFVERLAAMQPDFIEYLFHHFRAAADANAPARTLRRSLRKLDDALRSLRPQGRPVLYLGWEIPVAWPTIERLYRQFIELMRADRADFDEQSAHDAVDLILRALHGDSDAQKTVQLHAAGFMNRPIGLDDAKCKELLAC